MDFSSVLVLFTVWQYGLWSFQTGGTKLERYLPKNQHTQRKLLNLENWVNGEVLKIGHHFSKESDLNIDAIKKKFEPVCSEAPMNPIFQIQ